MSVAFLQFRSDTMERAKHGDAFACTVTVDVAVNPNERLMSASGQVTGKFRAPGGGRGIVRVLASGGGQATESRRNLTPADDGTFTAIADWRPDRAPECGRNVQIRFRVETAVTGKNTDLRITGLRVADAPNEGLKTEPCTRRATPGIMEGATVAKVADTGNQDKIEPTELAAERAMIEKAQAALADAVARVAEVRDRAQRILDGASPPVQTPRQTDVQPQEVYWYHTLIEPRTVADTFGKRIAERFVAVQVTIANKNQNRQYLVHDISFDYRELLTLEEQAGCSHPTFKDLNMCEFSSHELALLRGVAEKGQAYDPRNVLLRTLQAAGTIGGGLIGLPIRGPSYASSVAIFNGPIVSAFRNVFPDFTGEQLNRLSDAAYIANSLIPKGMARVIVAFLPQSLFLEKAERDDFWKEPHKVLHGKDFFRKLVIRLDGEHIVETASLPPAELSLIIATPEAVKFAEDKPEVAAHINGRFLQGGTPYVTAPDGVTVARNGAANETRIDVVIRSEKPLPPGTPMEFKITKENKEEAYGTKVIQYEAPRPVLNSVSTDLEVGKETIVTFTGENLMKGFTTVIVPNSMFVPGKADAAKSSVRKLIVPIKVASGVQAGAYRFRLKNPGGESEDVAVNVK